MDVTKQIVFLRHYKWNPSVLRVSFVYLHVACCVFLYRFVILGLVYLSICVGMQCSQLKPVWGSMCGMVHFPHCVSPLCIPRILGIPLRNLGRILLYTRKTVSVDLSLWLIYENIWGYTLHHIGHFILCKLSSKI